MREENKREKERGMNLDPRGLVRVEKISE